MRLKRDLFKRSNVGLLLTGRSVGQSGTGTNGVYGIDGTFGFFDNLNVNTYWARSQTGGRSGKDTSFRGQIDYALTHHVDFKTELQEALAQKTAELELAHIAARR